MGELGIRALQVDSNRLDLENNTNVEEDIG